VLDGRYRIDGVLGGGAMARVYRAEHLGIARPVAIKVLHAALRYSRDAVTRFQREATTSGRLVHPNIVTVTDAGMLPDGRCFLVMEALDGETLADRLEHEGRLPWRKAVALLGEILAGLRLAHDHGVVHRDIKPENLFLLRGDASPLVKILDFGIARLVEGVAGGSRITQSGLTIGTPLYMSPEQAVDGEITPASDLYSSTVVLFEMVTGQMPFYYEDPVATMKAHLNETPPSLQEIAPELDLPEQLEEIVRRGLAKTVIERIPSADSYLRTLDELMAAEAIPHRGLRLATAPPVEGPSAAALIGVIPAAAPPPHEATVLVRPRSGTRRLVIAGVLIAVGIAIFAAVQALRSSSEPEAEGPLAAPAPDAPARDQEPPQARPETPPHDAEAAPGGDGSGARPAREGSARAPDPAEADPARAREQVKRWLAEGNRALAAGRFDEAAAQFQRALAADGNAHAAQAGLAEVAYNRGDFARAEQSAKRAVALAPRVAAYRMTLAKAYYKLLRYDDAIAQWQKVLELEPSNERAKKGIELAREKRAP